MLFYAILFFAVAVSFENMNRFTNDHFNHVIYQCLLIRSQKPQNGSTHHGISLDSSSKNKNKKIVSLFQMTIFE